MSQRKTSSDDRLFISAVAAVLVGLALLLRTTGVAESVPILLPFIVTGAGGVLLYLAVVRRFADPFFFTGVMFCLGGVCMIATALLGARFKQAWPCYMVAAGLAWLATGLRGAGRLRAGFAVPAFGFIFLGSLFVLFSAGVIRMSFGRFFAEWWPSLLILGGLALFAAYGANRPRQKRAKRGRRGAS